MAQVGYFSTIAKHTGGRWLGVLMSVGGIVAQIGQANGGSLIADEALQVRLCHYSTFVVRNRIDWSVLRHCSIIAARNLIGLRLIGLY